MTQGNIGALRTLRDTLVEQRRAAAKSGDAQAVIVAQQHIVIIDAAIADERALGQAEKDEEAMGRAIKRGNSNADIGEVSIIADPIKRAD